MFLFNFLVFVVLSSNVSAMRLNSERQLSGWDSKSLAQIISGLLDDEKFSKSKVQLKVEVDDGKGGDASAQPIWLQCNNKRVLKVGVENAADKLKILFDNRELPAFKDNHFFLAFEAHKDDPKETMVKEVSNRLEFYHQNFDKILLAAEGDLSASEIIRRVQSLFAERKFNLKQFFDPESSKRTEKNAQGETVEFTAALFYYDIGDLERAIRVTIKAYNSKAHIRIDILGVTLNFEVSAESQQNMKQAEDEIKQVLDQLDLDFIGSPSQFLENVPKNIPGCDSCVINFVNLGNGSEEEQDSNQNSSKHFFVIELVNSGNEDDTIEQIDTFAISKPICGIAGSRISFVIYNLQSFRYLQVQIYESQVGPYYNEDFIALTPGNDAKASLLEFLNSANLDLIALKSRLDFSSQNEENPDSDKDPSKKKSYSKKDLALDLTESFNLIRKPSIEQEFGDKNSANSSSSSPSLINPLTGRTISLYYRSKSDSKPALSVEYHLDNGAITFYVLTFLESKKSDISISGSGKSPAKAVSQQHEVIYLPIVINKFFKERFFEAMKKHGFNYSKKREEAV